MTGLRMTFEIDSLIRRKTNSLLFQKILYFPIQIIGRLFLQEDHAILEIDRLVTQFLNCVPYPAFIIFRRCIPAMIVKVKQKIVSIQVSLSPS